MRAPDAQALKLYETSANAQKQAARLWPRQPVLQAKWLQAVEMVRATSRGWRLDNPLTKEQCNAKH